MSEPNKETPEQELEKGWYDKPALTDEERLKISRFMEGLGFHLEQNHKTPASLRRDELWMSNDKEDQPFYPHSIHQDLAKFLYEHFVTQYMAREAELLRAIDDRMLAQAEGSKDNAQRLIAFLDARKEIYERNQV